LHGDGLIHSEERGEVEMQRGRRKLRAISRKEACRVMSTVVRKELARSSLERERASHQERLIHTVL